MIKWMFLYRLKKLKKKTKKIEKSKNQTEFPLTEWFGFFANSIGFGFTILQTEFFGLDS